MVKTCCCCCSLQTGTKVISIFQIIGSTVLMICAVVYLVSVIQHMDQKLESVLGIAIAMFVVIILLLPSLILGIILFQGAKNRDLRKCKIWFNANLVLAIMTVVAIVYLALSTKGANIADLLPVLPNFYYVWVVHAFMEEIRNPPQELQLQNL